MSDEEKTHAQLIEDIIAKQLKPFIVLASVLITIFAAIAVPIAGQVLTLTKEQSEIETKVSQKVDSDEAYRNFLSKRAYLILQKNEHESDMEAIANPENSEFIYMKNNNKEAEQLEITTRSGHAK
jgi:Na+-translocating ferredoxin:NAD+ oxidoreductase RnfG subunit